MSSSDEIDEDIADVAQEESSRFGGGSLIAPRLDELDGDLSDDEDMNDGDVEETDDGDALD